MNFCFCLKILAKNGDPQLVERLNNPISRKNNLVVQETESDLLIFDLIKNKAFCLNQTAALIWQLCDGNRTTLEISRELNKTHNVSADESLVWLALDQLKKENLIENEVITPTNLEGKSRRQIIREIGLGSMVMLPLVSSLVAPSAIHAASIPCTIGLGGGGCTSAAECCSPAVVCVGPPSMTSCCVGPGTRLIGDPPQPLNSTGNCASQTDAQRNSQCDLSRGPGCCTGNSAYVAGSCVNTPTGSTWNCVCVV